MTSPQRLIDGDATDFERALLDSWQRLEPSREARAKTLAKLGMGVGAAAVVATTAKAAGGSIAPKAIVASSVFLKLLGVIVLGTTVTVGTLAYVHHDRQLRANGSTRASLSEEQPRANAPPVTTNTASASGSGALAPSAGAAPPAVDVELGPNMAPNGSAVSRSRAPAVSNPKSTLDEEVAMVAEARQAEAQGDSARAIQLLDAYDQKFPNGSLARESTTLRIEALVAEGNRSAAEKVANRFLASHPSSLDVRNVRRALDTQHDPGHP
jgi:hypothetical protein